MDLIDQVRRPGHYRLEDSVKYWALDMLAAQLRWFRGCPLVYFNMVVMRSR